MPMHRRSTQLGWNGFDQIELPTVKEGVEIGMEWLKTGGGGQALDDQMIAYQGEIEREIPTIVYNERRSIAMDQGSVVTLRRAIAEIENLRDQFVDFALYRVGTNRAKNGARDIQGLARRNIALLEFEIAKLSPVGVKEAGLGAAGLLLIGVTIFTMTRKRKPTKKKRKKKTIGR